ncbi:MAG: hypothetical protein ACO1SX_24885, partial [Actinomycetota bacterium]
MSRSLRLPLLSTLLLVFSLAAVTAQSQPETGREPLSSLWRRPVADVAGVFVCPDGQRTVTVSRLGNLSCLDGNGEPVWSRQFPGADRVVMTRSGTLTLAYSARRPLYRSVYFLDARGEPFFTLENEASVQSVVVAPDGRLIAVAAGKTVTLCSRSSGGVKQRSIQLEGEITHVQLGPADTVYVAARNPDYVALVKSTGKVLWKRSSAKGSGFAIAASEDGKLLGIGSQRPDDLIAVSLVNAKNERIWSA